MTDALPFLPYPEHLQEYVPCTDVADYLEGYHKTLGLHILTSATATPSYDTVKQKWKIAITPSDQPTVTVISNHLVVATGVGTLKSDVPFLPSIPGKVFYLFRICQPWTHVSFRHLSMECVCTLASTRMSASLRGKMQSSSAPAALVMISLRI